MNEVGSSKRDDLKQNKLEVSTIHGTKGREKDLVILYGFDEDYFEIDKTAVNQPLDLFYVGITRAKQKIILLRNENYANFSFLDLENKGKHLKINVSESKPVLKQKSEKPKKYYFDVTSLLEHTPFYYLANLKKHLKVTKKSIVSSVVDFKMTNFIKLQKHKIDYLQDTSSINGKLVTLMLLHERQELSSKIAPLVEYQKINIFNKNELAVLNTLAEKENLTPSELCQLAVMFDALESGKKISYNQLEPSGYNWVTENDLFKIKTLMKSIKYDPSWEVEVPITIDDKCENFGELKAFAEQNAFEGISLGGVIDAYDPNSKTVWEFKNVDKITETMIYQLLIYGFILKSNGTIVEKLKLFNLRTKKAYTINFKNYKELKSSLIKIMNFKINHKMR
nr:3'-5' exonuclease [Spiroplasma clarkii]